MFQSTTKPGCYDDTAKLSEILRLKPDNVKSIEIHRSGSADATYGEAHVVLRLSTTQLALMALWDYEQVSRQEAREGSLPFQHMLTSA